MEYKCKKHMSNKGWYDSDGKWHCWSCTKESKYFYPDGKIVSRIRIGNKEVRIVKTEREHEIRVEQWDTKKLKEEYSEIHDYMSTATRAYKKLVSDLENISINSPDSISLPRISLNLPRREREQLNENIVIFSNMEITNITQIRTVVHRGETIYFLKCKFDFDFYSDFDLPEYTYKLKDCSDETGYILDNVFNQREIEILNQFYNRTGIFRISLGG